MNINNLQVKEEILRATKLGLWIIEIDTNKKVNRMYADENMKAVMGIEGIPISEEDCYEHWYSRINDGYYNYVNRCVDEIIRTGEIVELEYTWNHPSRGQIPVRCVGCLDHQADGVYVLNGYHRIVEDMRQRRAVEHLEKEVFEYNERKQSVYFHTGRKIIAGEAEREEAFPEEWIRQGIVHPYFVEEFRDLFTHVRRRACQQSMDVMLKNKKGEYEWFRMSAGHLSQGERDVDTMLVTLDSKAEEQDSHLQYLRRDDFYQTVLSETAAYLEIDLENDQILGGGGLWKGYMRDSFANGCRFQELIDKYMPHVVPKEFQKGYYERMNLNHMRESYQLGQPTMYYQYRRNMGEGTERWMELVIHVFKEQVTERMYALLYLRDIDEKKRHHLEQERAASRDALTDVFNRASFKHWVEHYMETKSQPGVAYALLMLDLDGFKRVNDQLGHQMGDEILVAFAQKLEQVFSEKGCVGRLGGDEFQVFWPGCSRQMLNKTLDHLMETLKERSVPIFFSAGITWVFRENFDYQRVVRLTDEALYESKRNGKNQYTYYQES